MSPDSDPNLSDHPLSNLLDLTFPAHTAGIGSVAEDIDGILSRLQVPEPRRLEIGLAVQEALVNAVVHGCKNDASQNVHCRMQSDAAGRIVIVITDPGPGFNADSLADPKSPDNVFADHGRGVYLIRQLMDEVHFEQGGSQIRMWKY